MTDEKDPGVTVVENGRPFKQGYFQPKNPHKYVGDITKIRFMSSWELNTHKFLDGNPNILKWSSEELYIPYIHPADGKVHRYYPDYWVKYKNRKGDVVMEVIEVKPASQVHPPKHKKLTKNALFEQRRWAVNQAKWIAAKMWCQQRGMTFRVATEHNVFGKSKRVKKT